MNTQVLTNMIEEEGLELDQGFEASSDEQQEDVSFQGVVSDEIVISAIYESGLKRRNKRALARIYRGLSHLERETVKHALLSKLSGRVTSEDDLIEKIVALVKLIIEIIRLIRG